MTDATPTGAPLRLFNSLTRQIELFQPVHPGEARVYSCGPTVYNYPHIGNMRAYVFADVLGRTLGFKGYKLRHVINITDVGHLTDDADAGEDKLEKAAAREARSIWGIARHYTEAYWLDVKALNIRQPTHWSIATDYVPQMIEFAKGIADEHCYELDSGLYFDVATVADYGRLARDEEFLAMLLEVSRRVREANELPDRVQKVLAQQQAARDLAHGLREKYARTTLQKYRDILDIWEPVEKLDANSDSFWDILEGAIQQTRSRLSAGRIETVKGKRNEEDFAIWRKTPSGEKRQMEWDSPWGRGAPGWHLECSVMSRELLGLPFDIHTGGIDHREIHHPNEIAQNQAIAHTNGLDCAENSGARIWMHNNFLVERSGKMSKSSGQFLRLQLLIDKGFHPLAYRMMCLQAHYRSELEFSWEGLGAALTRLKRIVMAVESLKARHAELVSASMTPADSELKAEGWTLKQVQGDEELMKGQAVNLNAFDEAISNDLTTPEALTDIDLVLAAKKQSPSVRLKAIAAMDSILGLNLLTLTRADLRIRPKDAQITEAEIEAELDCRQTARTNKDFATSDAIRDALAAKGVEVMDGDPLRWEWAISLD